MLPPRKRVQERRDDAPPVEMAPSMPVATPCGQVHEQGYPAGGAVGWALTLLLHISLSTLLAAALALTAVARPDVPTEKAVLLTQHSG